MYFCSPTAVLKGFSWSFKNGGILVRICVPGPGGGSGGMAGGGQGVPGGVPEGSWGIIFGAPDLPGGPQKS